MSQLTDLTKKSGHAAHTREVRRDVRGSWERAGAGSPYTHWGVIAEMEAEADQMEQQIEDLIDADPKGAARSEIGRLVLDGYAKAGILVGMSSDYPYRFEPEDLIKNGMCIQAQLVAEEYFEDGPEACPLTPEAFLNWDFEKNRKKPKEWVDPFSTYERPNVTIDYVEKMERVNFDPSKPVQEKPELREWTSLKT
jgi:hypothetical protein